MDELLPYVIDQSNEVQNSKCPPINSITPKIGYSWIDQFFTPLYYVKNDDEHFIILFHTNRVCLVGLAPNHCARSKGIAKISFLINLNNAGKAKNKGFALQETTPLATVTCNDGGVFKIPSCVKGKLIGYNHLVLEEPSLLTQKGYGYVAVVLLKLEEQENIKIKLMSQDDYAKKFADC